MSEVTILLQRVCTKATLLKNAYETNQDAYLAHHVAGQRWMKEPTHENAKLLVDTECAWENTRDTILTLLRGLLDKTNELLNAAKPDEFKAVRKAAARLSEGFSEEAAAFTAFSQALGDITAYREAWEACSAEVISQGWPLLERIQSLVCGADVTGTGFHAVMYFDQVEGLEAKGKPQTPPPPDLLAVKPDPESTIETDLDGTAAHNTQIPAWASATTQAEQDRIIYENRKATLGQKAAGRMIAQSRYWAKQKAQREEDTAKFSDTDDLRDEARGTFY